MRSSILLGFGWASIILASPTLTSYSDLTNPPTPESWTFAFTNWSGPGCPDYPTWNIDTRQSIGPYNMNSSADTWWFYFAYPWLRVNATTPSVWCEAEVKYTELADHTGTPRKEDQSKYRLRMHKNGTTVEANYNIDEGNGVVWKVTYGLDENEVSNLGGNRIVRRLMYAQVADTRTLQGPLNHNGSQTMHLEYLEATQSSPLPRPATCATATFRMKIELSVTTSTEGRSAIVDSKTIFDAKNSPKFYGVNHGISYGWEACHE